MIFSRLVIMPATYSIVAFICVSGLLFFAIFSKISPKYWQEYEFQYFIRTFNKSYANDTEYKQRFSAFKKSLELIEIMNKNRKFEISALYGITPYSDMLEDEFLEARLEKSYAERMASIEKKHSRFVRDLSVANLPRKIDWRTRGAITPVNNQRDCGACWAFSTIETIEAAHWQRSGELHALSTQQMIDCARNGNNGCRGGDICTLLQWLVDNDVAVSRATEYPLHLKEEQCLTKKTNSGNEGGGNATGVRVIGFACLDLIGQENDLLEEVANFGPVAVAVNAISWQNYLGGVIQHHCGSHPALMNHAVQIVGYDLEAEIPHYLVRNSWGEEFGAEGYVKIAVGDNLCGIANEVAVVEVS